tara:strand:+ start:999 stop:2339 length:1341 start_codon:yes stop_codon:yes gene_type:complete
MSKPAIDRATFVATFNNVDEFPTLADVAIETGLSLQTVRNRATIYRREAALDDSLPQVINRAEKRAVPMSEDQAKFMEDWGPEECCAELRRVAEIDPDHVVSRNYFRVHSDISESTWSRYFGTFLEFKRQAGIMLSRPQHALERHIAKHASVDHYRAIGNERLDYADKYERESGGKYKTILVGSDIHDEEVDRFWLRVFIDTARRVQPDVICLNGDLFDLPEFGKYGVDPREWDVVGRIRFAHDHVLRPLREACPNAQIDLIEGNHELRLLKHMADATPALRAVLSDLHDFTISKLLGLDEFEVNYIAKGDLGAFTKADQQRELAKNYKVYWRCLLAHHFPSARNMGLPGWCGHHHKHIVWPEFSPVYGAYEFHQLGSGHKRSASYAEGEKWGMGFAIANCNIETLATNFDYVPVTDFAVAGGKWYHRAPDEVYGDANLFALEGAA